MSAQEAPTPMTRVVLDEPGEDLATLLRRVQMVLLEHPVAANALFRAVVAEGRAFASTAEGRRWRDELAGSDLIRRGRVVWEVGTLNLLEAESDCVLPSKLLDAIARAAGIEALEPFLSRIFESTWGTSDDR